MKRIAIGLLAAIALFAVVLGGGATPGSLQASTPGSTAAPLLSCADVDGSGGEVDLFNDIFGVAFMFGTDADDIGSGEPDGYHPIYDVGVADGTVDLFNDVFGVAFDYGTICPTVDVQVAKATLWGIANLPAADDAAGRAALASLGYHQGSFDVPGQGVHYVKLQNWDGNFDPEAPEGVVYNNGKLAAQLYVIDGSVVGWGTHAATSWPPPTTPHDVDLEGDADGPQCDPACSWAAGEGWHLHYFLCTTDFGTTGASALPGFQTKASCASYGGGDPECTIPTPTVFPCYRWGMNVGWMGHLWNHQLNPNQIPDVGGNNGRFADCVPDGSSWKAFTCPA